MFNVKPGDYVKYKTTYYLVVSYNESEKKIVVKLEGRTKIPPEGSTVIHDIPDGIRITKYTPVENHGGSSNKTEKQSSKINNNRKTMKSTKKQTKKSKYYKRRTIKKH